MTAVPAVRCLVVTDDRALAGGLVDMLTRAPSIEPIGVAAAHRVLAAPPACDVVIVCDEPGRPAVELGAELAAVGRGVGVVALTADTSVDTYRTALSAGVRAVVAAPPTPASLTQAVIEAARGSGAARAHAAGVVTAVASGCGGAGTSAAALALSQAGGGILADLSHGWNDLGVLADVPVTRVMTDLAQIGSALSGALEAVLVPAGNAQMLLGSAEPVPLELLGPGFGTALVRELRGLTPHAVVDAGRLTAGAAREALCASDRMLVVVTPDMRSCLAARSLLTAAARWGAPVADAGLIVNRWSRKAELSLRTIDHTTGCSVAAVVRDQPRAMVGYAALDPVTCIDRGPFRALEALAAPARSAA